MLLSQPPTRQRRSEHLSLRFSGGPPARAVAALLLLSCLMLPATCLSAQAAQDAPKPASGENKTAPAAAKPEYMGSAVCMGCHEEIWNNFIKRNPHRVVETDKKRGWEEKACESCHGPGSIHAESTSPADIRNPAKLRPAQADRTCLKCHLNTPTPVGRVMGGHARNQVACVQCHSVHTPEPPAETKNGLWSGMPVLPGSVQNTPSPTVQKRTAQCVGCHQSAWAEFQRPHRHKLPEGAMTCTDCHNPHGGTNRSMQLNASLHEPGCFRCHSDKRGPFTFEHAPVRTDGCSACHQPHGSANPRMLTRAEVRFQCLECHSNVGAIAGQQTPVPGGLGAIPPAFHDLRSPRFRNCTLCHVKIHGSHVNRDFTR